MKSLLASVLILVWATPSAFATAQYPDKIIYEGKEYQPHTNPMEPYFAKHPELRPHSGSTALWRGYVATFLITNKTLVVSDIQAHHYAKVNGETERSWKSVKKDVLPDGAQLALDWFTGILVLPHGKMVNYVHEGYGSTYSNYILLEIKKGKLNGKRSYDYKQYEEFRDRQFQAYKKTDEYKQRVEELKGEDFGIEWTQEMVASFLRYSEVANYTSKYYYEEDKEEASNKTSGGDVQ
jgi:hypothetical protein